MTTLRSSDKAIRIRVQVGEVLTVTAPPGSTAYVVHAIDMNPASTVTGAAQTFGPYSGTRTLDITCQAGAVDVRVSQSPTIGAGSSTAVAAGQQNPDLSELLNLSGLSKGVAERIEQLALPQDGSAAMQHYNLRVEQSTYGGYSWQTNFTLPSRAAAMRLGFAANCAIAGGATIDRAIVAASSVVSSNLPTGAWNFLTFNRANTLTQPYTATASVIPLAWSDWLTVQSVDRTDTPGALPAYAVRGYSASTNTALTGPNESEPAYGAMPFDWRTLFKSGDYVTASTGGFTSPGSPNCGLLYAVQYIPEGGKVPGVAEFSDSLSVGYNLAGSLGIGQLPMASQLLGYKFTPFVNAFSGRSAMASLQAYLDTADQLPPGTIVLFRPYSRNGWGANYSGLALQFVRETLRRFHRPVLQTGVYESAVPANNATMQVVNAATRSVAATFGIPVMELEYLFNAANAATTLQGDGIHPTDLGRTMLKQAYAATIAPMLV